MSSCCSDDILFLSHYSVLGLNSFYGFQYGVVSLCRLRPKWISSIGLQATKSQSKPHHHTKVAASFMPQARILHVTRFNCIVFGPDNSKNCGVNCLEVRIAALPLHVCVVVRITPLCGVSNTS